MRECTVAVIGGGLVGCASAYYLSKLGAKVILVERGQINSGASGRNAGSLHFQLEHRQIVHRDSLVQSLPQVVRLSVTAINDWKQLEQELDMPLELVMKGGLMLAESPADLSLLKIKYELEREHGLETHLLSDSDVKSLAPYLSNNVLGAAFCPHEGHCNPRTLTNAFATKAVESGSMLLIGTEVTGVTRANNYWDIKCRTQVEGAIREERIRAEKILIAAGAWTAEIALMVNIHLPIFAIGLTMNVTEELPHFVDFLVQHVGKRISLKQVEAGNVLIGGGWPARIIPNVRGSQAVPTFQSIRDNLKVAVDIVPSLRQARLIRTWAGITGVTSDQLPLLGEVTDSEGVFVAAGGAGFTMGPTYSRLISELIVTGQASTSIAPYSPARFDHINMFRT